MSPLTYPTNLENIEDGLARSWFVSDIKQRIVVSDMKQRIGLDGWR